MKEELRSFGPESLPSLKAKKRLDSSKWAKRFSSRVLPEVRGIAAAEGKQSPRIPELPVLDKSSPMVLSASAV